jgi:hypothetical protein
MVVRDSQTSIRVLVHGLAHFSRLLPSILDSEGWDIRNYSSRDYAMFLSAAGYLARCDLVYTWSGRITMGKFLSAARALGKRKLVMFWCGSDVSQGRLEYAAGKLEPWIAEKIHWAGAPWLAEEIRSIGLACEYVPSTWVPHVPKLAPLPPQFRVLAYLPDATRAELYGIDQVLEVARALPTIQFSVVGLRPGQSMTVSENVSMHEWVQDMVPFYRNSTVLWRPTRHDGLSFTALEALAYGRHVIWSYPFPGALHAMDARSAQAQIERLFEEHQAGCLFLNTDGARFVSQNFSASRIRDGILSRWSAILAPELQPIATARRNLGTEKSVESAPRSSSVT